MPADSDDDGYVGPQMTVQGLLRAAGTLRVEGRVEGDLVLRGHLVLAHGGCLQGGAFEVTSARIDGHLLGDLHATGRVELGPLARVEGKVLAGSLVDLSQHQPTSLRPAVDQPAGDQPLAPDAPPLPHMPSLGSVRARLRRAEVGS